MQLRLHLSALIAVAGMSAQLATAATETFTGATSAANTNAVGNGTFNYGAPYAYAGPVTTYTINAGGSNLSGAYTAGDDLLFDGSAAGSSFQIAVDSAMFSTGNANSFRFNDAGGAGKTYIFARANSVTASSSSLGFAAGTGTGANLDTYNSTTPFGGTASPTGSTSLVLDTGFTGTVVLRSRANSLATGTTTIKSGTLIIQDGGALPTNGTSNNNPGTVTLAGGKLVVNINTGNPDTVEGASNLSSAQTNAIMNVTANSTLSNGAINFDGSSRRQDLWGGSSGPINLSPGVTLTVETGIGATIKGAVTGTAGSTATLAASGPANSYLRLNTATGGNANVIYDIGTSGASLDMSAGGVYNLGQVTGASNTALRGSNGTTSTTIQVGNLGLTSTYGGQVVNGFGASNGGGPTPPVNTVSATNFSKVGVGTTTLSGENRYTGTTAVSNGTLKAGSTSAFGDSASTVTASTGGTLDLNGQTQEAGKAYVLSGGSLVNNSGSAVSIHSGAALNNVTTNAANGAIFGTGVDTGGGPSAAGAWTMQGGTTPTVTITGGGGAGATAVAEMQVGWLRLNQAGGLGNAGSGYVKAPTLTFSAPSDPNGRTAKAYVQIGQPGTGTAGTITGIQIIDPGWGYTSVPTLTIDNTGTGGTGFSPMFAMAVSNYEITNAGSGYTSAPTITVTGLGTASHMSTLGVNPTAPTVTGGFGSVVLTSATNSNIGGSGDINVSAVVSGAGNLNKIGNGKVTFSGTNTYSGNTVVQGGILLINGANTGTGSVTANLGTTLGGTGSIAGAVTIDAGANLSPGASIESLDVGSLSLNGTMVVEYDGSASPAIDVTNVLGALTLGATSSVDFNQIGAALDGVSNYVFATYTSMTGTFGSVIDLPAGYSINYAFGGNSIALQAVPEASAFLTVAVAAIAGTVGYRRRRRSDVDASTIA